MKIGLMGFEFSSPNKGCEALTYSFLDMLDRYFTEKQEIEIYNFTEYDLGFLPKKYPRMYFEKIPFKLKDIKCKYLRKLRDCDVVFDVTMGDSFSDIYSLDYFHYLLKQKLVAAYVSRRYVLLPQTYGPFQSEKILGKIKSVLKHALEIYCRDALSQKLLKEKFGINHAILTSDMAFQLPYDKLLFSFQNTGKVRLGINVSGLLYKGGFHSENQFQMTVDYKKYIKDVMEYYLSKPEEYEIYLIPHVIDSCVNAKDDDTKAIGELKKAFPQVHVAPAFETPVEAKSYIANMDLFIGSRMHSTVAAFSSGVVTIPVSYSRKFEGLYHSVEYPFIINVREENNESALQKTIAYINKREELRSAQREAMSQIGTLNNAFERRLFALLDALQKQKA